MKKLVLILLVLSAFAAALAACSAVPAATTAAPTEAVAAPTGAAVAPATADTSAAAETPAVAEVSATPEISGTMSAMMTAQAASPTPDTRPTVPAPVEGQRPLALVGVAERDEMFSGPAAKYVEDNTIYVATIVTDKGNIVAELYQDTPEGLNNFVTLALNGFYDGLTFHRVEPGFVIQGGDPLAEGNGGPGYTIPAEINHPHPRGVLAWARTGDQINPERRSSGSQFYITLDEASFLDGAYSVFGYVIEGMDVVDKIEVTDVIRRIDIAKGTTSLLPTPTPTWTPYAPASQQGRPLATVTVAEREGYFNAAPEMTIDVSKEYQATIETDKGKIVVDLDAALAPISVNNFVTLANLGYYDGMKLAYVEPGVYAVFGSPGGSPASDVGYTLPLEASGGSTEILTGTVSMYPSADRAGALAASGAQFFIAFSAVPQSATPMNLFGTVAEGMDVAEKLATGDVVKSVTITEK